VRGGGTGRLSSPQGHGETMRASIGLLSALRRRDESTCSLSSSRASFLHARGIYLVHRIRRAGRTYHGRYCRRYVDRSIMIRKDRRKARGSYV
jgi:hypothetical protein